MTSTALVPIGDLEKMAQAVAASKLFGVTTAEQALALMLVAQAEGLHPATAARDYHVIQGRPALKADAMLARYLTSGGKVEWHDHTDQRVSATFSHPAGGTLTIDWDFARAKLAGLGAKDMWLKYPRQMLRARVISEGIRATNPSVATGVYTPEEVHDMEPLKKSRKEKDMGDAQVVLTRSEELEALCTTADVGLAGLLSRAGVAKAEEMSDRDYEDAVAMLKRKALKMQKAPAQPKAAA